ncbi:MAG: phosphatase PAP2 family protein [Sedimentisphaerales bacterium]|nr:phosphatase PAP2 family protein [Sedimentisphaerales bacterium]
MNHSLGRLLWSDVAAVLLCVGVATQAATADAVWIESAKADFRAFPARLERDAKATFLDRDNAAILLWAGLASVAMNNGNADDDVARYFERHDTFGKLDAEALNVIGSPPTHFAAAALWYGVSANHRDEINKQRALTMFTALTINGVATTALKAVRQNDRPAGDAWAWPSGHTSSSFTVASVLHEFYGLKVGIPAYVGAGLVAYRMMDVGDHWASDVVFGATLGLVVGHTVARHHKAPGIAGFEVLPYYGNQRAPALGVSLARRF